MNARLPRKVSRPSKISAILLKWDSLLNASSKALRAALYAWQAGVHFLIKP